MKKNLLLFFLIILLSLTLFNFNAEAVSDFIEKGFTGIIVGKVYDFIFREQNSNNTDNLEGKNKRKNNKKLNNIEKININNDGVK